MPRRRIITLVAGATILALSGPAGAHDLTPEKTKILDLAITAGDTSLDVSGLASFGGQKLLSLGKDPAGDSFGGLKEIDLVEAKLGQLDPGTGDLSFVFKVADLQAVGIPEAAEYWWGFKLAPIDQYFLIASSFTNAARGPGQAPWAGLWACDSTPTRCNHVQNVTAEYVGSDNEIFVDVPQAVLEKSIGRELAGLRIAAPTSAWEGLETTVAYGSVGGDSGGLSPGEYLIAYPRIDVGIAPPGTEPTTMTPGTVGSDGSFSASVDTAALAPGPYDVVTKACYGTNCATWTTRVVL